MDSADLFKLGFEVARNEKENEAKKQLADKYDNSKKVYAEEAKLKAPNIIPENKPRAYREEIYGIREVPLVFPSASNVTIRPNVLAKPKEKEFALPAPTDTPYQNDGTNKKIKSGWY